MDTWKGGQKDGQMEGKLIVPSDVNTGMGLKKAFF